MVVTLILLSVLWTTYSYWYYGPQVSILVAIAGVSLIIAASLFNGLRERLNILLWIKRTPALTPQSELGTTVKVEGRITYPHTKTPYGGHDASYYFARVEAVFQSERRAPSSGMQTHMPTLHRVSLRNEPIIVQMGEQVVHLAFDEPNRIMLGLQEERTEHLKAPKSIEFLTKLKHERFIITERWLGQNARIFAIGQLVDRNQHSVTLTNTEDRKKPGLIIEAELASLENHQGTIRLRAFMIALALFVSLSLGYYLYANW